MRLAILETGYPPGNLADEFGNYPQMFERLLGPDFEVSVYDVQAGELPAHHEDHPAYLVTGSPAGVYDPLPWIAPLMDFIRSAKDSKMVGVCFGHQVMAHALGGHVEKSQKGWGAGLHSYAVLRSEQWIDSSRIISIPASHQDQVIVQPPNTHVIAASDFTPLASLAWTDRDAISFQFHPEFSPAFAKALIEKRYDSVTDPDLAIASLDGPNDSHVVGGWIRKFLNGDSR